MKLFTLFIPFTISIICTLALPGDEVIVARDEDTANAPDLFKRQCDYDTPCKGYGWAHTLHCGDGNFGCVEGNVYQIGGDTNVCDYGTRTSCQKCGKLTC
ncbi:hypothetical protein FRC14_003978 [Serendipita sp. 396]|nr:hypothetical protein FRC14_003978 [Serendipita sp. 396]KAG8782590.1 hypothetical protein FRC15_006705 [Serendipita sp. 397]KAG8821223.1 hypothetical protein FRC19_008114 [Serendipita sp. 401]KAG8830523.1 hypothetical protein FRC18_007936 [Serendipita sp. 400]KAG8861336.1 hypothetical protein FRB91_008202 [Serendipita sp. 411]KAG9053518.1 hypothetical protein FS842_007962 [Serendipita sp. 407]